MGEVVEMAAFSHQQRAFGSNGYACEHRVLPQQIAKVT